MSPCPHQCVRRDPARSPGQLSQLLARRGGELVLSAIYNLGLRSRPHAAGPLVVRSHQTTPDQKGLIEKSAADCATLNSRRARRQASSRRHVPGGTFSIFLAPAGSAAPGFHADRPTRPPDKVAKSLGVSALPGDEARCGEWHEFEPAPSSCRSSALATTTALIDGAPRPRPFAGHLALLMTCEGRCLYPRKSRSPEHRLHRRPRHRNILVDRSGQGGRGGGPAPSHAIFESDKADDGLFPAPEGGRSCAESPRSAPSGDKSARGTAPDPWLR